MNWNYLKTNWFYLAFGALLAFYAIRKYPALNPFQSSRAKNGTEKITNREENSKKGAALLGFVPDTPRERSSSTENVDGAKSEAFLKRFAPVAFSERKKFGIPASIILAAAYVNSQAGQAETVSEANNFFALSCADGWEGETSKVSGECMRKYETAWASFRDFSIHLSSQEWFGSLKKASGKDWRKWVEKLGSEGVADAKNLRQVIEAYRLEELD